MLNAMLNPMSGNMVRHSNQSAANAVVSPVRTYDSVSDGPPGRPMEALFDMVVPAHGVSPACRMPKHVPGRPGKGPDRHARRNGSAVRRLARYAMHRFARDLGNDLQ
jgi:hypothetical protein